MNYLEHIPSLKIMHYLAFGSQKKKRLNRVFDAIGFVYPDFRYPPRGQKRKGASSEKVAASAAPSEPAPKGKKLMVLTHRPRYIEPIVVPEYGGETSSATVPKEPVPPTQKIEKPAIAPKAPSIRLIETKVVEDKTERSKIEKTTSASGILSPSTKATVLTVEKSFAITPRRRRMVNVLDILETPDSKRPSSSKKIAEAIKMQDKADPKQIEAEAITTQDETGAGHKVPAETKLATLEQEAEEVPSDINIAFEKSVAKETESLIPEASSENLDYIIRHAAGKKLSKEEIFEANHYAQELKYPKGALVFNSTDEDDFLYCLPDNKELSVCREMARSMGFPKLEAGLCAMTKEDLADSLAYNSLKVHKL
jgi:hypothetical protein